MIDDSRLASLDPRFGAIGLLPGPDGAALLPSAEAGDAARLARGDWDGLPAAWRFIADAWRGEAAEPDGAFNVAIRTGDPGAMAPFLADADPNVRTHAVSVAFRLGGDEEPVDEPSLDPRVGAYAIATRAHACAHRGDAGSAIGMLRGAAERVAPVSPCAAARYIGESASLGPGDHRTFHELQRASERLEGLGFEALRGELLMTAADIALAMGGERPAMLQQGVALLQKATQALPRRTHPVAFAVCHMNIGVAYLSMPMNEHAGRLRGAIAVQSLRESLEVLTPDRHPELWESATLNLANALQHLPSAHVSANLLEAVDLYGAVLERRGTPGLERARVLASLGSALAHLGRFDESTPRLAEARAIFEAAGDNDALRGIDDVVTEIGAVQASGATGGGGAG